MKGRAVLYNILKLLTLLVVNFILGGRTITVCNQDSIQSVCPAIKVKPWSYDNNLLNGPQHWGWKYPACKGRFQSPVNIITSEAVKRTKTQGLVRLNYDRFITKAEIQNNGYTVSITPTDGVKRQVVVREEPYLLKYFNFHWGSFHFHKLTRGSEHEIDGKPTAMELQLVHYNKNGLIAVVALLFQETFAENYGLKTVIDYLRKVQYEGDKEEITPGDEFKNVIRLSEIFEKYTSYYSYNGSMTTPPCTENITWLICEKIQFVHPFQMRAFRELSSTKKTTGGDKEECGMVDNFRPVQPLNGRSIYYFS